MVEFGGVTVTIGTVEALLTDFQPVRLAGG
jgi:hypothetical protein